MGNKNSKRDKMNEIVTISTGLLNFEMVDLIMLDTGFDENELLQNIFGYQNRVVWEYIILF